MAREALDGELAKASAFTEHAAESWHALNRQRSRRGIQGRYAVSTSHKLKPTTRQGGSGDHFTPRTLSPSRPQSTTAVFLPHDDAIRICVLLDEGAT